MGVYLAKWKFSHGSSDASRAPRPPGREDAEAGAHYDGINANININIGNANT